MQGIEAALETLRENTFFNDSVYQAVGVIAQAEEFTSDEVDDFCLWLDDNLPIGVDDTLLNVITRWLTGYEYPEDNWDDYEDNGWWDDDEGEYDE